MYASNASPVITKVLFAKGSALTVIPKSFLAELGIDSGSYLQHTLGPDGSLISKVVRLPSGDDDEKEAPAGLEQAGRKPARTSTHTEEAGTDV